MKTIIFLIMSAFSTLSFAAVVEGNGANSLMASLNYIGLKGTQYENADDSGVIYRLKSAVCKRNNNSVFSADETYFMIPSYECSLTLGNAQTPEVRGVELTVENANAQSLYKALASFAREDHVLGGKTYVGIENAICNINLQQTNETRFVCTYDDINNK